MLGHYPFLCGTVCTFRDRRGDRIKLLWRDNVGMWPVPTVGNGLPNASVLNSNADSQSAF
jgi:hypothetical protein